MSDEYLFVVTSFLRMFSFSMTSLFRISAGSFIDESLFKFFYATALPIAYD